MQSEEASTTEPINEELGIVVASLTGASVSSDPISRSSFVVLKNKSVTLSKHVNRVGLRDFPITKAR